MGLVGGGGDLGRFLGESYFDLVMIRRGRGEGDGDVGSRRSSRR